MLRLIPLLAFLTIPLIEIGLFIVIGGQIGLLATVGIVIVTAIIGASLLRQQGLSVVSGIRADLDQGRMPIAHLADGLCLLIAAVFLLTPGFLTDSIGFLLFVPAVRSHIGRSIWSLMKNSGVVHAEMHTTRDGASGSGPRQSAPRGGPQTIDGEAVEIDPDADQPFESGSKPNPHSPWRS